MMRRRDMPYPAPTVIQDNQPEQQLEANRRYDKEIDRCDAICMVLEKCLPGLRRRASLLNHVLGDRRLGDVNAEFEQLAVNARRSPQNIRLAHLLDQRASLGRDLRSSHTLPALHSPKQPEAGAMPANDRIRFNNQYRSNRQREMSRSMLKS